MQPVTMRRLLGVLLILVAGAYWYTRLMDVDISELNLPEQIGSPVFWFSYAAVTSWCMVPQLTRTPGAPQVDLLPTTPTPFQNQIAANSEPFQMEGKWYQQNGGVLWVWDELAQRWVPANAPTVAAT